MSRKSSNRYVVLQDYVPVAEQRAIARAVIAALPTERPTPAFVEQLGHDLLTEARQRGLSANRAAHVVGWVAGGVLSLVTGVVIWLLVQRNHEERAPKLTLAGA